MTDKQLTETIAALWQLAYNWPTVAVRRTARGLALQLTEERYSSNTLHPENDERQQ